MATAKAAKLMTVADLIERWELDPNSGIVMDFVRSGLLKFVDLSPAGVKRSKAGQKTIRFRPDDVEAFEAERTRAFTAPADSAATEAKARETRPVTIHGWDGRTRGRGASKPR